MNMVVRVQREGMENDAVGEVVSRHEQEQNTKADSHCGIFREIPTDP